MPYITVESGTLSDNQKELLIKRLTEVSSASTVESVPYAYIHMDFL